MKTGKTLQELAIELDRQMKSKKDFIAPASQMKAVATIERGAPIFGINLVGAGFFPTTTIANTQLATFTGIPAPYFKRMEQEAPGLLAINVNRWLEDEATKGTRRMARTLDGSLRALLSDKFRPMDNFDLAQAILPVFQRLNLMVLSCDVTERRMYIKAVDEALKDQVPSGARLGEGHVRMDAVAAGMVVSNSEVGQGSLSIEAGVYTFHCTNLASFGSHIRKFHVGSRADMSEEVREMLTDETKRKTDEALWGQVRDVVASAFTPERFAKNVERLTKAAQDVITNPINEVVEAAREHFTWTETERDGILEHLMRGGDFTRYGLHAAVTRASADLDSYDRASELERQGGQIIELSATDWQRIAA